ncbi:MAG: MMPL family transporter [bacterium]|nr:MMPL family transporter [bacterium]
MKSKNKENLAGRIASFITNKPWLSLGLALLFIILAIPGLSKMQADFSYRIWFSESDPLLKQYDAFERRFGNDETVAVIVHSPSGIFDKESVELLQSLTADMWLVPEIMRVESLSNYNWTHSEEDDILVEPLLPDDEELTPQLLEERRKVALSHEVLPGYLVSKDGKTAMLYASIKPSFEGSPDYELIIKGRHAGTVQVEGVQDKLAKYRGKSDHVFHVTGSGAISDAFREAAAYDLSTLVPILLGVIVLFILVLLRRFSALAVSFAVIIGALLFTFGISGLLGIKFNNIIATLPNTLIAISIADAIHIMVTFLQFKRSGLEHKSAVYETLTKNLLPTFLTSASTAIGFFSFFSAKVQPISDMGYLAGIGVLAAWVITIFLVGPMLTLLPIKVKPAKDNGKILTENISEPKPWAMDLAGWIQRRKVPIIASFIVITLLALYVGLQNEVNSDPFKYFPEGFHLRTANEFVEDHVGGATGVEMVIDSKKPDGIKEPAFLKKVESFQEWLNNYPHVTKTVSIIDILKATNRSLHGDSPEYYKLPESKEAVAQQLFLYTMSLPQGMDLNDRMTIDNDALRVTVLWTLHKSKEATENFEIFKSKANAMGLNLSITGKTTLYQSMNGYVVSSFIMSLSIAVLFIGLLMVITFRSLKTGLMSLIPNFIPLMLGAGLMTILGKPLDIGTVIVTSICLGIAVDDTIHFLTNYYKWLGKGYDRKKAVAMVFSYTGPALLVTTLILAVGFGTFAFAMFVPNINFGILTALILTSALITDLLLLPAIVMLKMKPVTVKIWKKEPVPIKVSSNLG